MQQQNANNQKWQLLWKKRDKKQTWKRRNRKRKNMQEIIIDKAIYRWLVNAQARIYSGKRDRLVSLGFSDKKESSNTSLKIKSYYR